MAATESAEVTMAATGRYLAVSYFSGGIEDSIVPFPIYAAMLSSQLIVTIADRVPEFDVGPSCRESTVADCLAVANFARDKLIKYEQRY
jgi:hypothetical protein